jgi:hypothetical protein
MIWLGRLALPERSVGGAVRPWQHRFRCWRPVAQRAVRPDRIVVPPPALDQHLDLPQRMEDFSVQQLVPKLAIEALVVAILL